MQQHTSIEIMSPAGSFESLQAAIQGGANSVYFGVGSLNMRSKSSKKFTIENLGEIASICQENDVRTYITLNTVMYDQDMTEMKEVVDAAKENNITAIIASDISVIQYCRSKGMEIHISTQSNVSNIDAVRFYSAFADVMVTARELSLEQVKEITQIIEQENITGPSAKLIQIEVFAHGALCMAVSGKCYLSLDNLNSSANRGACLQQCRRPYKVIDQDSGIELELDHEYIMSPKDLCTIEIIDKILDAGVRVLKIEGRGRSPEYVKTVTSCYREAVDSYLNGTYSKENIKQWMERLASVYNRGFWQGYYMGKTLGEWTEQYGSQATRKKMYIGKVTNFFKKLGVAEIKVEANILSLADEVLFIGETTGVYEQVIEEVRVDLKKVEYVNKGETCSIQTKELVRRGDKLYKWVEN